jgi:threonine aldolase
LKEDHDHAKRLAHLLQTVPHLRVAPDQVDTNIVIFDVTDPARSPADIVAALKTQGVLINAIGGRSFRAVTHLNVSGAQIDEAGAAFARILAS